MEQRSDEWHEKTNHLKSRTIIVNDCWVWTGPKFKDGYGLCGIRYLDQRAHRASYKLFKGEIPNKLWVLHSCDVPLCINPDHLYLGDVKQNVKDAIERGLFPSGPNKKKGNKGIKNPKAKLSEEDVIFIINSKDKTRMLVEKFKVDRHTITSIRSGKTWNHIKSKEVKNGIDSDLYI